MVRSHKWLYYLNDLPDKEMMDTLQVNTVHPNRETLNVSGTSCPWVVHAWAKHNPTLTRCTADGLDLATHLPGMQRQKEKPLRADAALPARWL